MQKSRILERYLLRDCTFSAQSQSNSTSVEHLLSAEEFYVLLLQGLRQSDGEGSALTLQVQCNLEVVVLEGIPTCILNDLKLKLFRGQVHDKRIKLGYCMNGGEATRPKMTVNAEKDDRY